MTNTVNNYVKALSKGGYETVLTAAFCGTGRTEQPVDGLIAATLVVYGEQPDIESAKYEAKALPEAEKSEVAKLFRAFITRHMQDVLNSTTFMRAGDRAEAFLNRI